MNRMCVFHENLNRGGCQIPMVRYREGYKNGRLSGRCLIMVHQDKEHELHLQSYY